MLGKIKDIYSYSRLMGIDWFLFRLRYELRKKSGYFDKKNAEIVEKERSISADKLYFEKTGLIDTAYAPLDIGTDKADNATEGRIFAFSHQYLDYTVDGKIAWNYSPVTKIFAADDQEWNTIPDFGELGDIKLVWEASRFPQVYYFIDAYAQSGDAKYAKSCLSQIEAWIDANPYPYGVNYKCGQEISFRIFAWIIALEYFGEFLSDDAEGKIVRNIYTTLLRVDMNIDYAARSVKNNHSISEAAGLLIGGLLFPQFEEAEYFTEKGMSFLLKETEYQVYQDGSYLQHSFTYERLAMDVLSLVLLIAEKKKFSIPVLLRQRHARMISFLHSFVQPNGWLPNYGSNDGAYLFPLGDYEYRDFRPSLNFASLVNSGEALYEGNKNIALLFGLSESNVCQIEKRKRFDDGGYYILKNNDLFLFTRCHSYRDRPAHNDMLHLDIWYKGENLFCDAGSYSYNTDKRFKRNFTGTLGHNTIIVNDTEQMKQVLNFGWSNWTKSKLLKFEEQAFSGEHYGYKNQFGITHRRDIKLSDNLITVIDTIKGINSKSTIKQIWNSKLKAVEINEHTLQVGSCIIQSNVPYSIEKSYISDYYNEYTEGYRIVFETTADCDTEIKTTMEFES